MAITLGQPVSLEPGLGFAVREGGRTVAAGTVQTVAEQPPCNCPDLSLNPAETTSQRG